MTRLPAIRPRWEFRTPLDDDPELEDDDYDVEALPYDDTDPTYLQTRRTAQAEHYRAQVIAAERRLRAATLTRAEQQQTARDLDTWRRLLAELDAEDHFATGDGDRRLF